MKGFRFKIHPLFWIFGALLILLGNGYLFLVYIFTATLHEYAHSLAASFFKVRADEIILYPYGAVLYGQFDELKPSEEAIVALAGPALNLLIAVLLTALWWIVPEIYTFTDIIVSVNVSIALFNLIPVYPLDGGRILMSIIKLKSGALRAFKIVKIMGVFCCLIFILLYFFSLTKQINYAFAVAAVFMLSAVLESGGGSVSSSCIYPPDEKYLCRGIEKRLLLVSGELTLFQLLKLITTQYYYIFEVSSGGKVIFRFEHSKLEELIIKYGVHTPLRDIAKSERR